MANFQRAHHLPAASGLSVLAAVDNDITVNDKQHEILVNMEEDHEHQKKRGRDTSSEFASIVNNATEGVSDINAPNVVESEDDDYCLPTAKKLMLDLEWTPELHHKFINAVNHEPDDAVVQPLCHEEEQYFRSIWLRVATKYSSENEEAEEAGVDDSKDYYCLPTTNQGRLNWTQELHQKFINAVMQIGNDKVTAKKILPLMNVPGLTTKHVANHLSSYRISLKRSNGSAGHDGKDIGISKRSGGLEMGTSVSDFRSGKVSTNNDEEPNYMVISSPEEDHFPISQESNTCKPPFVN